MKLTGKSELGREITNLTTWFKFAPPKAGKAHWKDYRSARELARCWCREGLPRCPSEMLELLNYRAQTRSLTVEQVVAEMEIDLDRFPGGRRNADLAFWGCLPSGKKVVATVEAKADECFDVSLNKQLMDAAKTPKSNIAERVNQLTLGILDRVPEGDDLKLPYQLFTALAATARLAKLKKAKLGVLIIHEFISLTLDFDKLIDNANSYKTFVHAIPGWETQSCKAGRLMTPLRLHGSESVPHDIWVTTGKIRTLIPLDADGRERPSQLRESITE